MSITLLKSTLKNHASQLCMFKDITERKKMELKLTTEHNKLNKIFETMQDGVYIVNKEYTIKYINRILKKDFGNPDGKKCYEYLSDLDKPCTFCKMKEVFAGKTIQREWTSDRNGKTYDIIEMPMTDEDNIIVNNLMIFRDISKRKETELERQHLLSAIMQAGESIIITDLDGIIESVNPAFEKTTGYTREEAIGQNIRILERGNQGDAFYNQISETLKTKNTWKGRFINKKKDGTPYTEDAFISPVYDAEGNTINYVSIKRDITANLKLEEQLQQSQKMESVGRLAGGIAHDFNNMLGVILGNTEIALEHLDPSNSLHTHLTEIKKAGERSADLTRQLLTFARKQTAAPKILNLNDVVESMHNMLKHLTGEDIDLVWMPKAQSGSVKIDPSQIDQILANLCINARSAIEGVGKIIIETDDITLDKDYCTNHPEYIPGDYVLLAVSDTGCGMDPATLKMIFEPFFTTKKVGEGTGLGLATVYGIVKQNDGIINVYSKPGQGTTFKIYLHRYAAINKPVQKSTREVEKCGSEIILLVEDEAAILRMITMMLKKKGYNVMPASNAGESIRLADEYPDVINLLITDVVMPEMNGRDLAKNLLNRYPNLKRLFMSGYTADVIAHNGVLDEGMNFIQKPFMIHEFASKVREVLDKD